MILSDALMIGIGLKPDIARVPAAQHIVTRHLKTAAFLLALTGLAILAFAGDCDMRTFRLSPTTSDAAHSVMQESHGVQRFKTPEQAKLFVDLNIVGVVTFAIGAALLLLDNRLNKRHA